jgi:hypothetical protein
MQPRSQSLTFIYFFTLCLSTCLGAFTATQSTQQTTCHPPIRHDIIPPTPEDKRLEAWYSQQGILGTDRVQVRTTSHSVAGRGLFYSATARPAAQGDLLAFIPSRCILTRATGTRTWPDLLQRPPQEIDRDDWPVLLTAYARRALDSNDVAWSEWIQTWQGPKAPRPPSFFSNNELENIAKQTQSTPNEIKKALQARYNVFEKHCTRLEELSGYTKDYYNVGHLYGIVLSRSATLGPDWNYESGIIPLHDMLNHPPMHKNPSVELFSIGEIASHTCWEHVTRLVKRTFSLTHVHSADLVLVARQTIRPGEELFLSYTRRDLLQTNEHSRVWKALQYGFCPL